MTLGTLIHPYSIMYCTLSRDGVLHDTFHVLMLRKYIPDPSHVLREQPVQLKENLTYEEIPVQIINRKEQVLRSKVIPLVKVLWKNHERKAATWEPEVQMRRQYPQLFFD